MEIWILEVHNFFGKNQKLIMYLTNYQQICNFECVLLTHFVPLPQVLDGIRQDIFLWNTMQDWKLYMKMGQKLFLWILCTISGYWYHCPLSRKATKSIKVIKMLLLCIPEFFPSQWKSIQDISKPTELKLRLPCEHLKIFPQIQ